MNKTNQIKTWKKAREIAQDTANKTGATFYAFQEWDGSIAIEIDYPKSGIEFETFKPVTSASVVSDSPTSLLCRPTDRSPNNTNGQATFKATYRQSLREAVEQFPEQYVWRYAGDLQTEVERVAERMFDAMNQGSFNHDSKAFKITARKLGIKPTRTAILAYWNQAPSNI